VLKYELFCVVTAAAARASSLEKQNTNSNQQSTASEDSQSMASGSEVLLAFLSFGERKSAEVLS
jgi:hypothetical protein